MTILARLRTRFDRRRGVLAGEDVVDLTRDLHA
jgi:hypothetical protein